MSKNINEDIITIINKNALFTTGNLVKFKDGCEFIVVHHMLVNVTDPKHQVEWYDLQCDIADHVNKTIQIVTTPDGNVLYDDDKQTTLYPFVDERLFYKEVLRLAYLKGYRYIARESDGDLYLYPTKPTKGSEIWLGGHSYDSLRLLNDKFECVQFSNSEATPIIDLLESM